MASPNQAQGGQAVVQWVYRYQPEFESDVLHGAMEMKGYKLN